MRTDRAGEYLVRLIVELEGGLVHLVQYFLNFRVVFNLGHELHLVNLADPEVYSKS